MDRENITLIYFVKGFSKSNINNIEALNIKSANLMEAQSILLVDNFFVKLAAATCHAKSLLALYENIVYNTSVTVSIIDI